MAHRAFVPGGLAPFVHHLAGRKRALATLFALGIAGSAVSLATPLIGKAFVDAVATRGDFGVIPMIAVALVLLGVLDLALGMWSSHVHARVSAHVLADLRAALFERCLEAPLDDVERFRHGDLLTRFGSDAPRVQGLLVDGVIGAAQAVLFLLIAAIITVSLSPALALWSFVGVLLALAATSLFRSGVEARTRRVRDAMVDLSHFLAERVTGLRAVRFHRASAFERAQLAAAHDRLGAEVIAFQSLDALAKSAPALLMTLALAWVYVLGGRLLESGTITLGTFVAFVLYQARLFAPAQGLLGLVRNLQEARVSIERVQEVLTAASGRRTSLSSHATRARPGYAIELRNVTFGYAGKPAVLREVSLLLKPGERVALFGASGAGKSTLVQILFGLRVPPLGEVMVEGGRAQDTDPSVLGYAGAEPFLLHASVAENVRYGAPRASDLEVERALALADAAAFVSALPQGIGTVIGGRGLALSDGQRQRLGLARALLQRPRILVLDEAFSALDLETEARIRDRLQHALSGCTMLAISHRPCALETFDRLLFLHDGRIVAVSAPELRVLLNVERAWA